MIYTGNGIPITPGPSQGTGFRTGTVVAFNPATLENIVAVGTAEVANLPIIGVAEAAAIAVGSTVALKVIRPIDGGLVTYAIDGAYVTPGSAAATAAVNALNDRMFADDRYGGIVGSSSSDTYSTLSGAGPVVSAYVGPAGRAVVLLGCTVQYGKDNGSCGGEMTVSISGATTRAASSDYAYRAQAGVFVGGVNPAETTMDNRACMVSIVHDLNPGVNVFTAQYRAVNAGEEAIFGDAVLTVISL